MSRILRKIIPFFCLLLISLPDLEAQSAGPVASYHLVKTGGYVQAKNYYLLTLLQQLPEVNKLISNDPVLRSLAKIKGDSLRYALKNCDRDGGCYTTKLKFGDEEIKAVSSRLAELYQPGNALDKMIRQHLIPSGCYYRFQELGAKEMLVKAWEQDAAGINFCIGVYAEGRKPNYPLIDSISYTTRDPRNNNVYLGSYVGLLYNTTSLLALEHSDNNAFYETPLKAALQFLELNERERAADYEPMEDGENKAALNKIKAGINWSRYTYSVIMIPGAGPDDPKVPLSAEGMLRCRFAAIQYQKGLAPFIVVSGGKVHPYKTIYCEAIEMKKFMVEKLHIPSSAIIIDPHARHTTTNMRNTVRLMYRYGMPFSKAGITCTTRGQSTMIGTSLIARCIKELNAAPYKNGKRLSETEIEFYPLLEALHINPSEPMDP